MPGSNYPRDSRTYCALFHAVCTRNHHQPTWTKTTRCGVILQPDGISGSSKSLAVVGRTIRCIDLYAFEMQR